MLSHNSNRIGTPPPSSECIVYAENCIINQFKCIYQDIIYQVMNDDEENSDEDDDDDIQFLGYAELEDVRQGKIRVNSVKPKQLIGKESFF